MKAKWAVKVQGTGQYPWTSVYFFDTREKARFSKKCQKEGFKKHPEVVVTLHKALVGKTTGTLMVGSKIHS